MAIMGFANGKPKLLFIAPDKNDAGHIYQIFENVIADCFIGGYFRAATEKAYAKTNDVKLLLPGTAIVMTRENIVSLLQNVKSNELAGRTSLEAVSYSVNQALLERTTQGNFKLSPKGEDFLNGKIILDSPNDAC